MVNKIQNFVKPEMKDIDEMRKLIIEAATSAEEYNELFQDDSSIVCFVRKNIEISPIVINDFLRLQKTKGMNSEQLIYIRELILFISQNGKLDRRDLLREELNFNNLFNSIEINNLITDIEERL